MSSLKTGDRVPLFELNDQHGQLFRMEDYAGKQALVVYFYPKDDTPGCTREACSFRDSYEDFREAGVMVIGISSDSVETHRNFAEKHRLPYTLLSDTDKKVRELFGVPSDLLGLLPGRVTYVVDATGVVRHIFKSQFQVEKHVEEALRILKNS